MCLLRQFVHIHRTHTPYRPCIKRINGNNPRFPSTTIHRHANILYLTCHLLAYFFRLKRQEASWLVSYLSLIGEICKRPGARSTAVKSIKRRERGREENQHEMSEYKDPSARSTKLSLIFINNAFSNKLVRKARRIENKNHRIIASTMSDYFRAKFN